MSDVPTVASSATPTEADAPLSVAEHAAVSGDVGAFRAARQAERTGQPVLPISTADAASAKPDDQAASTEASPSPASEPGIPVSKSGHKGNADTRIQELLADRAKERERADRLEREIADLRPASAPAQPTISAESAPATPATDPEPRLEDFESDPATFPDPYTAHLRALGRWEARQEYRRQQTVDRARVEAQTAEQAEVTRIETFRGRVGEALKVDPAFMDTLSADVKALKTIKAAQVSGERMTPLHAVAEELLDSPVAPLLMRHWTDHPEDLHRLAIAPNPRALLIEFGRQQAVVAADRPSPVPPPKTLTDAPRPPTTLGTRPTEPATASDAAVKNDDVGAFRAARLRERIALLR